jgi:hypothetical protein
MKIVVDRDELVQVDDLDNFRSFKIVCDAALDAGDLSRALAGLATVIDDGAAAWVVRDGLLQRLPEPPSANWLKSFGKMIETAARFGWVNASYGTVRAHVERRDVSGAR